ncbi:MAG: hypothetical protein M3400_10735, partial [Actinomycetota bacterium]|nr:hypothetical protein [Actinomycetota bacterium]
VEPPPPPPPVEPPPPAEPPPAEPPPAEPPAPGIGCADLSEQYSGSLAGSQDQDYYASSSGFVVPAGTQSGCLDGPAGVDFDLALQFWQGSRWVTVAISQSLRPDERITYSGPAGTYRWRVYSFSGSGNYSFGMQRP